VKNFDNIKSLYFLGIGGIGMSALARYFNAAGKQVWGYDKTQTKLTDELSAEKIDVHYEENIELVLKKMNEAGLNKENMLVIYTPAVPGEHAELVYFRESGFVMKKRAELLGNITENSYTVAVAGTHGKTTTSSLIAHILRTANIDCTAFLGGITQNYNTNLLLGKSNTTVVEADEYDRSFLTLHPDIAVITSVDADHLDIYGDRRFMHESYDLFAQQVKKGGTLIAKKGVEEGVDLPSKKSTVVTYSLNADTDYKASNITVTDGQFNYSVLKRHSAILDLTLGIPGRHNIENSVAAIAVAQAMNISENDIRKALMSFKGVKRRFEYHIKTRDLVYIDDYAHHPAELRACITAIRDVYPGKKITGIFQPHLYTRTRDFADEFARSLELLDELILVEIYPAREKPIPGVTSAMLLDKVKLQNKKLCSKEELVNEVAGRKLEVLLTAGAGDIDLLIEPITKALTKK
jgi:UDP-N-acetylmuramate--alanine ligase